MNFIRLMIQGRVARQAGPRSRRRRAAAFQTLCWARLLFITLLAACAGGRPPAWPPRAGEPTARVFVYGDRYHSILGLPAAARGLEEWAFGERIWFYDEKDTDYLKQKEFFIFAAAACRSLFWPNRGVIEISTVDKPFNARNPEEKVRVWQIPVSAEGLRRMREYLAQSIGSHQALLKDGPQVYYPAATRYHALHTCHHYVAGALRAGGVPVHPGYCLLPSGLWLQLDRLSRDAARDGTPTGRDTHVAIGTAKIRTAKTP